MGSKRDDDERRLLVSGSQATYRVPLPRWSSRSELMFVSQGERQENEGDRSYGDSVSREKRTRGR